MKLNPDSIRAQFPALRRMVNGKPAAYLDGPGGTQAPQSVIDAIAGFMQRGGSNHGGLFVTGYETDATTEAAREATADMIHASANEIAFGQNMTSLTFAFSRAVSRTWGPGDEVIVTRLDHDANIAPWLLAAEDHGATVRWLDINPDDGTLCYDLLPGLLSEKTRLLAITWASNALGSITQMQRVVRLAHGAGALVYVDAVHYAPHDLIDVRAVDCDFLVCSAYKFFGPHTGVLYGKHDLLDHIRAYKVRPAPADPPGKWETGTQSFESLAGVRAAVDYLASLGEGTSRRARIVDAMAQIKAHGERLSRRFLEVARDVPGLRVYGITDLTRLAERTPTFAVSLARYRPDEVARLLGEQGIFVWNGDYYAVAPMERLGVQEQGGLVRIGFTHYNTKEEVDRVLQELLELAHKRA